MSMEEALARLRPEWALTRDGDRWSVSRIWEDYDYGDTLQGIGFGSTIAEALDGAEAWTVEQERERAEREAKRIAEGRDEWVPRIWSAEIMKHAAFATTVTTPATSSEITISTRGYNPIRVKETP